MLTNSRKPFEVISVSWMYIVLQPVTSLDFVGEDPGNLLSQNEICRVTYSAALYCEPCSSRHEDIVILKAAFHYREQFHPTSSS
jgi:hypothetical protein